MPGNPKTSKWYATPRSARKRKKLEITLSDEARARLEILAEKRGLTLSATVEALILAKCPGCGAARTPETTPPFCASCGNW
jgi:hypothetical protein